MTLSLSEPLKSQNFIRFGWVLFESEAACDKALEAVNKGPNKYNLSITKSKAGKKFIKVLPKFDESKLQCHLNLSQQLIACLDNERGISENQMLKSEGQVTKSDLAKFDLQVLYLRKVHSYCYFSAAVVALIT
jgi:hypothetical protein